MWHYNEDNKTDISRKYPFLFRLTCFVVLPVMLVVLLGYGFARQSLPDRRDSIWLADVSAPVEIAVDDFGIPQIQGKTDNDTAYSLGWLHAQDRLWQMEMNRRRGAGRLSEVLGPDTLQSDILFRRLELYVIAERMWRRLDGEDRAMLQSYVDGVNAKLESLTVLPSEFQLLDFRPEAWRPEDSLVWLLLMSWNLSNNYAHELQRGLLVQKFGLDLANQLMAAVKPQDVAEVTGDVAAESVILGELSELPKQELQPKVFVGSNSWVVSGKHTKSGKPLLANDPHTAYGIPSMWYLASLKGDKLNVSGATFPGLPFVVIGHNNNIGWGITNMMADTQDLFVERINPSDRQQYLLDGQYLPMTVRYETIEVKHQLFESEKPPYRVEVRRTVHGPVISSGETEDLEQFAYSLRWTSDFEDGSTFKSLRAINYAQDWQQFNAALADMVAPVQNFIYADKQGNIGYVASGKIPIRAVGNGSVPTPGWLSEHAWQGYIPSALAPRRYNPDSGIIVTANNNLLDEDYPYFVAVDWAPPYRAQRIETKLQQLSKQSGEALTAEDMRQLQGDVLSPAEPTLSSLIKSIHAQDDRQKEALALLRVWDGNMSIDSVAATIMVAWQAEFLRLVLEDELGSSNQPDSGVLPRMSQTPNQQFIEKLFERDSLNLCDHRSTPKQESCQQLLSIALAHSLNELSKRLGSDMADWQWGKVHLVQFPHFPFSEDRRHKLYGQTNWLGALFHRSTSAAGGENTVNVGAPSYQKVSRFAQYFGAEYRQVLSLDDDITMDYSISTGQSGSVLSRHYDDLLQSHQQLRLLKAGGARPRQHTTLIPQVAKDQ